MVEQFTFYVGAVSLVYGVAAKLGDILHPTYFQKLTAVIRGYSFERSLQNANSQLHVLVDRAFGFRRAGPIYLPRVVNVAFISLLLSALLIWPVLSVRLEAPVFDPLDWDLFPALLFKIPTAVLSILVDYVAFAKSRTVLSIADSRASGVSILAVVACDGLLSLLLAAMLWYGPDWFSDAVINLGLPTLVMLAILVPLKLAAYYALASGVLIVGVFGIVAAMNYVIFGVARIDRIKRFALRFLNFELKPHIAAAVVLIVLFTVVYWPAVVVCYLLAL